VREFLRLVTFSEADGHLQQKLKQLLKLSKEKWEAACEHAKTAVQVRSAPLLFPVKDCNAGHPTPLAPPPPHTHTGGACSLRVTAEERMQPWI